MDELIDLATGEWDEALITNIFNPYEVQQILQILISPNFKDDFVAWHKTKTFTFTVRSAYFTEWQHQFGGRIRRSDGKVP
jgi:hypothetical protein